MAEAIEVQRYDKDGFAEGDGCYYMHADVAPLLAELATLRERTRMRSKTDDSHGGKLVLVKHVPYASDEIVFSIGRMREFGWSYVQGWWPLPEVGE